MRSEFWEWVYVLTFLAFGGLFESSGCMRMLTGLFILLGLWSFLTPKNLVIEFAVITLIGVGSFIWALVKPTRK